MIWSLAAEQVTLIPVPSSVDGVTTALIGFLLVCMAFPTIIKDRRMFFISMALAVAILAATTMRFVLYNAAAMQVFGGFVVGAMQLALLLTLFLTAGGMSVGELADEVKKTVEEIREGDDGPVIVIKPPPSPGARVNRPAERGSSADPAARPPGPKSPGGGQPPADDLGSIGLE